VKEETGLEVEPIRLIGIYSQPERDPRGIIVALYFCRATSGKIKKGSDAAGAKWFSINELPPLAGDRKKMIEDAFEYL
jgi:8-oxo-dGTP diphosphatase